MDGTPPAAAGVLLLHPSPPPPVRQRLSDLEIQRALGGLPGWSRRGEVLTRTYTLRNFPEVIAFVGRIAEEAERMNHHPDLDIRYNKLTCTLSTHDAGGITTRDLELAAAIEKLK